MQDKITEIFNCNLGRDGIKMDDDYLIMKISEELGEFIQSYIIHKKMCRPEKYKDEEDSKKEMAKELSDVIALIFAIADKFDIDLEEALEKKWITNEWIKKK